MNVQQISISTFDQINAMDLNKDAQLVLLFVAPGFAHTKELVEAISSLCPNASICGCSTAGEIYEEQVNDNSVSLTTVHFDSTKVAMSGVDIACSESSFAAGSSLAQSFDPEGLRHLLVFSDGLHVNGANLVDGLKSSLPKGVSLTGGLAADGPDFESTFVIENREILENRVVAVGLYGPDLKVGFGSKGGWDSFGMERVVTKSVSNVLYELDNVPALEVYKDFLGEKAKDLPGSGLLFPLSMRDGESELPVVRTILGIDEETQSLTFAGDIPTGSYVRLMKANVDRLIKGAEQSAEISNDVLKEDAELVILISCVGRRLVLKQLVEEEIEAVREVLGPKPTFTGFYSYGEIAPFGEFSACQLHNQTMTLTSISE